MNEIRRIEKELRRLPSLDPYDAGFIRTKYVRYADDWMIGIIGPRSLTETLR